MVGTSAQLCLGGDAAGGFEELQRPGVRGISVLLVPSTGPSPQKGLWLRKGEGNMGG